MAKQKKKQKKKSAATSECAPDEQEVATCPEAAENIHEASDEGDELSAAESAPRELSGPQVGSPTGIDGRIEGNSLVNPHGADDPAVDFSSEAQALARQLQRLACTAAEVAVADVQPFREMVSSGQGTDLELGELGEWEEAQSQLQALEAQSDRARWRARIRGWRWRRDEAMDSQAATERRHIAIEGRVEVTAARALVIAQETQQVEAMVQQRATEHEDELLEQARCVAEEKTAEALVDEELIAAMRQEVAEAEARSQRARSELKGAEVPAKSSEAAAGVKAEKVAEATEELEARGGLLEEEKAQMKEEVGTLRFALKDLRSFQHRRNQELDAQVKKLEKELRKLEQHEQMARQRSQEASRTASSQVSFSQFAKLHQLNERLTEQVAEVRREWMLAETEAAETEDSLHSELSALQDETAAESGDVQRGQERLDRLSESEGELRRERLQLQNRTQLLSRQALELRVTAEQTELQLEEAEEDLARARTEEQAAERRAEMMDWEYQVAKQQLGGPRRSRPLRSNRDAAASSDTGDGGAALGLPEPLSPPLEPRALPDAAQL